MLLAAGTLHVAAVDPAPVRRARVRRQALAGQLARAGCRDVDAGRRIGRARELLAPGAEGGPELVAAVADGLIARQAPADVGGHAVERRASAAGLHADLVRPAGLRT